MSASTALPVVGLGAGGHAAVLIEAIRAAGRYDIVGLTDPRPELKGTFLLGVPVLGDDDELSHQYHRSVSHAFIGIGGVSDNAPRRRLYELARAIGFDVVSIMHPTAVISPSARFGAGAAVLAHAVVNTNVEMGENVLVNTGAIVEHDCRIASHTHVAIGARIASGVDIGLGAHIGAGATVLQGRVIGSEAIVGAGAVVTEDVDAAGVVVGVPARPLRRSS